MRLAGIKTIQEANKFLKAYWPKHNKRFSVKPLKRANLHRPVPKDLDLDAILCRRTEHPLRNDFTIVHDKKLYQILDRAVGRRVIVEERINRPLYITYNGRRLRYKQIGLRPQKQRPEPKPRRINRPPEDHPWRKGFYGKGPSNRVHSQRGKTPKDLVLAGV